MRRWFLARFYRLWLGGAAWPRTQYADKEAVATALIGDLVYTAVPVSDEVLPALAAGVDQIDAVLVGADQIEVSPAGVDQFDTVVDP